MTLSLAGIAHAANQLDQSNDAPRATTESVGTGQDYGQTFTAGLTGPLTRVEVYVGKSGAPGDLTGSIYETTGGLPSGSVLATATVPSSRVEIPADWISFDFAAPTYVTSGVQYAVVFTATANVLGSVAYNFEVSDDTYPRGELVQKVATATWSVRSPAGDMLFRTYVNTQTDVITKPTFEVMLLPSDGATCRNSSVAGVSGTWVELPAANACTQPAGRPGAILLGWATSPNFPVNLAKRQVDNGWGAYETFNADGQLSGVFIPAGGATLLSAAGELYTVWSE